MKSEERGERERREREEKERESEVDILKGKKANWLVPAAAGELMRIGCTQGMGWDGNEKKSRARATARPAFVRVCCGVKAERSNVSTGE